jgi:two-component system, LytTR family, response regulator
MITCLIIDDEPLAVQLLEDYVAQTEGLELSHKCYNAMEALAFFKSNEVDIIFLDINMPKITGMELSSILPETQKIIFTTAYSEYAVESYEKNAVDYLIKPITYERFIISIKKIEKLLDAEKPTTLNTIAASDNDFIFVKVGKAIVKTAFADIRFIEALKDYVSFNTAKEKLVAYKRMKDLEESLPTNFVRIHNSYIINCNHIYKVEDNHVHICESRLPISEKYRDVFFEKINRQIL